MISRVKTLIIAMFLVANTVIFSNDQGEITLDVNLGSFDPGRIQILDMHNMRVHLLIAMSYLNHTWYGSDMNRRDYTLKLADAPAGSTFLVNQQCLEGAKMLEELYCELPPQSPEESYAIATIRKFGPFATRLLDSIAPREIGSVDSL